MKRNRIFVIGYFGYVTNQLDGQTVKTRDLYSLLDDGQDHISYYDTQRFSCNKFSIFHMLWGLIQSKTLIYLPAHNNLKYIFPIIFILTRLSRTKIYYFVIGGWLRDFIANKPLHRYMLKRIEGIYSETIELKDNLSNDYGFKNVECFLNFRFITHPPIVYHISGKLQLVFMARINKMKGLDMIFRLGDYIVSHNLAEKVTIDFYGPIFQEDKLYFEENYSRYDFMKYNGVLQPEQIHQTLSQYDAMLMPTHYFTEGLPGSIIDAYIAGVPVIVTKWKYAMEFVLHGETGFVLPFENGQEELNSTVEYLLYHEDILHRMKMNSIEYSGRFSAQVAQQKLREIII